MKKSLPLAIAMAGLLAAPFSYADDASGEAIGVTCFGCHGYDGDSKGTAPKLKGLPADYIAQSMTNFKNGDRPATIMNRIAKGYTDGEIKAMADYLASLK